MASRRIELSSSDLRFGCQEFGFIPRLQAHETSPGYETDDEELAYERHLKELGVRARVIEGTIYVQA